MFDKPLTKIIWKNKATLLSKTHEGGDVYTFSFKPDRKINWEPGQYVDYRLGLNMVKHFTIASAPHEGVVNITTRIFDEPSKFKSKLRALSVGAKVYLGEPRGELTITNPAADYIFIAGGIGITPFRAIIWDLVHKQTKIKATLLYASSSRDAAFKTKLDQICRNHKDLEVKYFFGNQRITAEAITPLITPKTLFLISGPPAMVEAYIKMLRDLKIPQSRMRADYFIGYTDKP